MNRMRGISDKRALNMRGYTLRLSEKTARRLRFLLNTCAFAPMRANAGCIETALEAARAIRVRRLAGENGMPRVLAFARELIAHGETRLDAERIVEAARAFGADASAEMRELANVLPALRIALCEAFCGAAETAAQIERAKAAAERWVADGGRGRARPVCADVFFEHALRLCMRAENAEPERRLNRMLRESGQAPKRIVERAHRIAADASVRLENLTHLTRVLEEKGLSERIEGVSPTEAELYADAIYARSDAATRADARAAVGELARALREKEIVIAREANRLCATENAPTSCFYLLDDEGRRRLRDSLAPGRRIRKRVKDPTGARTSAALIGVTALLTAAGAAVFARGWMAALFVPTAWGIAERLTAIIAPRLVRPMRLPKLKAESVSEEGRTLVALPVLLSGAERTRAALARMEALGALETDANVDFLLLGDFRDADAERIEGDAEILAALEAGVNAMNARAERSKYAYLMRGRTFRAKDRCWMGENRKRGAIAALNRCLRGKTAEGFIGGGLTRGGYRYVVTLDADTEMLPGTVQKLVGTMLHPLNARYAVLQPDMQMTLDGCDSAFVRTLYGTGGVDAYPTAVSGTFQDLCGIGSFAGKGIYEVERFARATDGALPDAEILSHDLIEGILAGAGNVCDVHFYDGAPENLSAELTRAHRWTRGDWQLLRVLFTVKMRIADRTRVVGNLLRSLIAPTATALILLSAWLEEPRTLLLILAAMYLDAIAHPLCGENWKRATLETALLPVRGWAALDAITRSLWRLLISRKRLMDWVPSAEVRKGGGRLRLPGRIAAILMLPALLRPMYLPAGAALAALFWIGVDWANDLAEKEASASLSGAQAAWLGDLARRTWRFFEEVVPEAGNGLPPDNMQEDPYTGAARRTSPTNIGLYLTSCVAANRLGLIGEATMQRRMRVCVDTLESLEKRNGQLYNWYDTVTCEPLRPRYVSSVDGGNLAASLLLCAQAVSDAELARRMRSLAEAMNFRDLYDPSRELFFIGMDVENGQISRSHYDLYASESRLLSFAAMMLGQIPTRHWLRLSRPLTRCGRQAALCSWSGTMFEYLMPELFLRSPSASLAGRSSHAVVGAQKRYGKRLERPWGVSESGYCAFDLHLNYQYRAFGLESLTLNAAAEANVVAPYAAALALCVDAPAAAENLGRMAELGWMDAHGMFEAADYRDGGARIVRSHMAHHQGMLLCAVCNALTDGSLQKLFMEIPQARALRLLLHERAGTHVPSRRAHASGFAPKRLPTLAYAPNRAGEIHILRGGSAAALVKADGGVLARQGGLLLNRFSGDLTNDCEGLYAHLNAGAGDVVISEKPEFDAGRACFHAETNGVRARLAAAVSPETGALYLMIALENRSDAAREALLSACTSVALADARDYRAHPAFQNLFVESERVDDCTLRFRRRSRNAGERFPELFFACSQAAEGETDLEKLIGRTGRIGKNGGIAERFTETVGATLNPCAALRARVRLAAGEKRNVCFALATEQVAADESAAARAMQLARAQARSLADFAFAEAEQYRLCQRVSAALFDAKLRPQTDGMAEKPMPIAELWSAGISGERPILAVEIGEARSAQAVRQALEVRRYYAMLGVETDLAVLVSEGGDYRRSASESARALCADEPHTFILDAGDARAKEAALRAAAFRFDGEGDVYARLRMYADAMRVLEGDVYAPMRPIRMEPDARAYGGFEDGAYVFRITEGRVPPTAWSNIVASEDAGALLTMRGGGFAWSGNSRSGRLTPFGNDALHEGWGWMFYLADHAARRYARLLPGDVPTTDFEARFAPDLCVWRSAAGEFAFETRARATDAGVLFEIDIQNGSRARAEAELIGFADWQMGTDAADAAMLRVWTQAGACLASGAAARIGCFMSDSVSARAGGTRREFFAGGDAMCPKGFDSTRTDAGGWTLRVPVRLKGGEKRTYRFMLEGFESVDAALERVRAFRNGMTPPLFSGQTDAVRIETPDARLNALANGFLPIQNLNARIRGRTGLHQPGGAYGFRDQLQDMLPLIYTDPRRVRQHLLDCAARQFAAGDVLHWWHMPYTGVRTRIRDDALFLPYVTARYVEITGDTDVLSETVPFLTDAEIPEGRDDLYAEMRPSEAFDTLDGHCMRALRRAAETGAHGLCRMGGGDWNDGMNRVGGESVWLTEFLAACAGDYAKCAPNAEDRAWLTALNERLTAALEETAWDGDRYLRAYAENGTVLGGRGSAECGMDAIAQAWAVFADLDGARCAAALDTAWRELVDEENGIIRLLNPPFTGKGFDAGYIAAYPEGIRENGGQYTHAACWLLIALIRTGDTARAHRMLEMLLPYNHDPKIYRGEPYVMAADVCADASHYGRAGWTWYTGSAAWMRMAILELAGFERKGNRVRVCALLGDWPEMTVAVRFGGSVYRLISRKGAAGILLDGKPVSGEFLALIDDGAEHMAVFPARESAPPAGDTVNQVGSGKSICSM